MKHILLILAVVLAFSCKTVHKITDENKTSTDTIKVIKKDSTKVTTESEATKITDVKDIHVIITYPDNPDGTVVTKPNVSTKPTKSGNTVNDIIKDAISSSGDAGHLPSKIEISIGGIKDSIKATSKTDSSTGKINDSTKIKSNTESYSKDVKKTGPTVGDYIIIIVVSLLVIGVYIIKDKIRI